ncbi:hypothetical protein N9X05_16335 [Paracoccaceae bacterium]|nr:hypothetical protein [Paracoccaceae bacterium]
MFQKTLADNRQRLSDLGICFLGPDQIRNGDFEGLLVRRAQLTLLQFRKSEEAVRKLRCLLASERRAGRRVILS